MISFSQTRKRDTECETRCQPQNIPALALGLKDPRFVPWKQLLSHPSSKLKTQLSAFDVGDNGLHHHLLRTSLLWHIVLHGIWKVQWNERQRLFMVLLSSQESVQQNFFFFLQIDCVCDHLNIPSMNKCFQDVHVLLTLRQLVVSNPGDFDLGGFFRLIRVYCSFPGGTASENYCPVILGPCVRPVGSPLCLLSVLHCHFWIHKLGSMRMPAWEPHSSKVTESNPCRTLRHLPCLQRNFKNSWSKQHRDERILELVWTMCGTFPYVDLKRRAWRLWILVRSPFFCHVVPFRQDPLPSSS